MTSKQHSKAGQEGRRVVKNEKQDAKEKLESGVRGELNANLKKGVVLNAAK